VRLMFEVETCRYGDCDGGVFGDGGKRYERMSAPASSIYTIPRRMRRVVKARTEVKMAKIVRGRETSRRRGGRASVRGSVNINGIGRAL
jgi:hypothetical protein